MTKKSTKVKKPKAIKMPNAELKGNKFELYVNNTKAEQFLLRTAGCCRKVWNMALALLRKDRLEFLSHLHFSEMNGYVDTSLKTAFEYNPKFQLSKYLTELKANPEYSYLNDIYSKSLQISMEDLAQAVKEANDPKNVKAYPRFKKYGKNVSFSWNGDIQHDSKHKRIKIPKFGWLKYNSTKELPGNVKNVTVSKESGRWYISMQTHSELSRQAPCLVNTNKAISIDVGVAKVVSLSEEISFEYQGQMLTGMQFDGLKLYQKHHEKMEWLQQSLAKKKLNSNNFKKVKARINKLHTKVTRIRRDFHHKLSNAIIEKHAYVICEDLKIKNMTASAAGTIENPGTNVAQKSGLNRAILDQGWGQLFDYINYKLWYRYGTILNKINPKYTSQKCSGCGYTHANNRETQAIFKCQSCGLEMNADLNAATNILMAGLAVLACGIDIAGEKRYFVLATDGCIYETGTLKNYPVAEQSAA